MLEKGLLVHEERTVLGYDIQIFQCKRSCFLGLILVVSIDNKARNDSNKGATVVHFCNHLSRKQPSSYNGGVVILLLARKN